MHTKAMECHPSHHLSENRSGLHDHANEAPSASRNVLVSRPAVMGASVGPECRTDRMSPRRIRALPPSWALRYLASFGRRHPAWSGRLDDARRLDAATRSTPPPVHPDHSAMTVCGLRSAGARAARPAVQGWQSHRRFRPASRHSGPKAPAQARRDPVRRRCKCRRSLERRIHRCHISGASACGPGFPR